MGGWTNGWDSQVRIYISMMTGMIVSFGIFD